MKRMIILTATTLLTHSAVSADIEAGKTKAYMCASCHGTNGIGVSPEYPNIAGQKSVYLIKQLQAYKDGSRKNNSMEIFAKQLSSEDIENIAAYYENLSASDSKKPEK